MPLGSIAEREHLKWQNASPIENNPYAPEKLQRRLSEKQSSSVFDLPSKLPLTDDKKIESKSNTQANGGVVVPEKLVDVFKAADKADYKR